MSDEKKEVIKKYGVWGKKSFLGKEFMGIVRTTFLINSKGKIHKIWNNVRVKDHAKEVFEEVKNLQKKIKYAIYGFIYILLVMLLAIFLQRRY